MKKQWLKSFKNSVLTQFDARGTLERHYRARNFLHFFQTHIHDREFQYEHDAVLLNCPLRIFPEKNVSNIPVLIEDYLKSFVLQTF